MALESATYINQLVPSNPAATDPEGQGYLHLNLIKSVLQATFPDIVGAVGASDTQLSQVPALISEMAALTGNVIGLKAGGTTQGNIVASGAPVASITLGAAGSGYTSPPTVTISDPTGSGASFAAVVASGAVTGFTLVAAGSDYTAPTVAIAGGGGTGATGTVILSNGTSSAGQVTALSFVDAPGIYQAGAHLVPHGVIAMWYGTEATIPAGWVICDGTNGTPNMDGLFPIGAGTNVAALSTGGAWSTALTAANMPSHNHAISDPGHNHGIADPSHSHSIGDPGHNHSARDSGHVHSVLGGAIRFNTAQTGSMGGYYATAGSAPGGTTVSADTGYASVGVNGNTTGIGINNNYTGVTVDANTTGITGTGYTGSGTSFPTVPPYFCLCFIMKL